MKRGICPKCGSTEVYAGTNVSFKSGTYSSNAIPVTFWHYAPLDNYVCADCGYVESYIADVAQLERIRENWPMAIEPKWKR
jgi:predicted nucleic-acid-binding Zn-ribbon protein